MMVLFLGGPWHDERHEVEVVESRFAALAELPAKVTVSATVDDDTAAPGSRSRRRVTYVRRYVRGSGVRLPVYVAPDYRGPARA